MPSCTSKAYTNSLLVVFAPGEREFLSVFNSLVSDLAVNVPWTVFIHTAAVCIVTVTNKLMIFCLPWTTHITLHDYQCLSFCYRSFGMHQCLCILEEWKKLMLHNSLHPLLNSQLGSMYKRSRVLCWLRHMQLNMRAVEKGVSPAVSSELKSVATLRVGLSYVFLCLQSLEMGPSPQKNSIIACHYIM